MPAVKEEKLSTKKVDKKVEKRKVIELLAKAFGLPIQGINLEEEMGNKPYINSVGLEAARLKYPDAIKITQVSFIKKYEQVGDTAVVVVGGEYRGATPESCDLRADIGTAGAANLNLAKNYPNEMAVTRAINRFLRRGLLPYLYREYEENIKTFPKEDLELMADYVADFGKVSAEELATVSEEQQSPELFMTNEEMIAIKPYLERMVQVETEDQLDVIAKELREKKESLNEKQLQKLRETFEKIKKEKGWI